MCCISIVRYLYFIIFSAHFLFTFLSPEIATSINIHVSFSLLWIVMSSLLLGLVLSVCISWFYNMCTLTSWLVYTNFGTVHDRTSVHYLIYFTFSLLVLEFSWAHTPSCLFVYCSFANTGHADIMWCIFSCNFWCSLHLLSVSVCNTLLRVILFVMDDLVMLFFRFPFLLLAIGMCHLRWWAVYL